MAGRALFLQIIEGKTQAHFIMDDPAGNNYLQVTWALGPRDGLPEQFGGISFPWNMLGVGFPLELWA